MVSPCSFRSAILAGSALAMVSAAATPVVADDVVTLQLATRGGPQADGFTAIIQQFEADNPDIRIEHQTIPYHQFMQTLTTRVVGGEAPDVAYVLDRFAYALAGQNALMDLRDFIDPAYSETLLDDHWQPFDYRGIVVGVPYTYNIQALVVNAEIMEAAGIDVPQTYEDAWSWWDLVEVARELKSADVVEFPFAHWPQSTPSRLSQYLVAEGGSILTEDKTAPNLDNQITRDILASIQETFEDELVPPDNWTEPDSMFPLWLSGRVGIQIAGGNFSRPQILQTGVDFDWTYSIMPTTLGTANPLIMFEQTEHPEEAWRFMEYLLEPEVVLEYISTTSGLPARQDITLEQLETVFGEDAGKIQLLMQEQSKGINPTIIGEMSIAAWSEIDLYMRGKLEELSLGMISPDELIAEAEPEIQRIIDTYN